MAIISFDDYLTEHYVNLLEVSEKEKYKDVVYDLLQASYASMGGLKGAGFGSADEMVRKIPMWKLVRKNGAIVACAMYKDKNGRKRVAVGSDGTQQGKEAVASIFKEDFSRAYFEISERSLAFHVKVLGYEFLETFAVAPRAVEKITGDRVRFPVKDDNPEAVRHPKLKKLFYTRMIGGHVHTKIMLGTPGKKIVLDS